MKARVLLNPGPVTVSERVRSALGRGDLCHRESEFYDLQDSIRARILAVFGLDAASHAAILLTGSGTAALEAAVASLVSPEGRMLVVVNGVYGERIVKIARAHGIPCDSIEVPWAERVATSRVEEALERGKYEVLAAVHHETTTGLISAVDELGRAAARHGATFLVDSVSGLGGEAFDFETTRAGLVASTANKCIQGLPGIAFAIVRREILERISVYPARTLYLHLPTYAREQAARSTPFTPAVQIAFALDEALAELAAETVAGRIARYRRASAFLRGEFERMGLTFLLPANLRSNTITCLGLPAGVSYSELHDALKEAGYVVYAGQGPLARSAFRVANMGWIPEDALSGFVGSLEEFLACRR